MGGLDSSCPTRYPPHGSDITDADDRQGGVEMRSAAMLSAVVMVSGIMLLTACADSATVTGTVTYRERIALPETGVVVTVQLQDVWRLHPGRVCLSLSSVRLPETAGQRPLRR